MKRRISCLLLTALTAASSVPCVSAYAGEPVRNDVSFTIGGMKTADQDEIYNIDGKNYLPLRAMFELLGGEVDWNKYKNEAKVTLDDMSLVIKEDGRATLNGEAVDIDAQRINGSIYLPVRLMGESLGFVVKWDAEERNIDIKKADSDYILLDLKADIDDDTRVLTFEEAQDLAEKKSSTLKNIEDSVDYMKDSRDSLSQTMTALDRASGSLEMVLSTIKDADAALQVQSQLQESISGLVSAARAMKQIDVQQSLTKVNEEMVRDGLEITLLSQINAIKGTEISIQLLEQSVAIGAEGLDNTKLKNSLGYASDVEVKKAELSQEELEKNLALLNESLATQKEALNFTLGLNAKDKVYVECDKE
ncbi:MAG: copper amine oxidase N-terminal domain-containing protein, partial [Firmicutes bacterium]|nr:copper amine oxidase N-terminal domain-containing protein [Bacillota bacterium]